MQISLHICTMWYADILLVSLKIFRLYFVVDCYSRFGSLICYMFRCTLLFVHSSFSIILMGKRPLVALLGLSSRCLVIVVWLFLAVPRVCLRFVNVVFPNHIHLLFWECPIRADWLVHYTVGNYFYQGMAKNRSTTRPLSGNRRVGVLIFLQVR